MKIVSLFFWFCTCDPHGMTTFHCNRCDTTYTASTRDLVSTHATSEGRIAYVRCPLDHLSIVALDLKAA